MEWIEGKNEDLKGLDIGSELEWNIIKKIFSMENISKEMKWNIF
jgi:hypothetical protein